MNENKKTCSKCGGDMVKRSLIIDKKVTGTLFYYCEKCKKYYL